MTETKSSASKRTPILGCIADDVTGATDLATNLVQGGMRVVQLLRVPTAEDLDGLDADAVVVGLKTRSVPADEAVSQSLQCLQTFQDFGIKRHFFKYCSTFDSTPTGNIGPVADALLKATGADQTIFCPAFPSNGRTVYQGHLFVFDKLLNESGMERHPLNPMKDANLVRVLGEQSLQKVGLVAFEDIQQRNIEGRLRDLVGKSYSFVIMDALNDEHLALIASAVANMPLVTGGSRIGRFLADRYRHLGLLASIPDVPQVPSIPGRSLIISGSCSLATYQQVLRTKASVPAWRVDVDRIMDNQQDALASFLDWAASVDAASPLLIYSTSTSDLVETAQSRHGADRVARSIETFLATAAEKLVTGFGVTRLIVAGGETSGAVVETLGIRALRIGPEICPGVPWTQTTGGLDLALALKSGNFGSKDFFDQALRMLP